MAIIYTIGFTKKSAETFFKLLQENNIKRVIDVRLNNSSQLAGFTKGPDLKYFLKTIGNIEAVEIALENQATIYFDEVAKTPFFHYVQGNITHEVWFEDARSILEKYRLLQQYPLYGLGCWQIQRLFRAMWLLTGADLDAVYIV